MNYYEHHIGDYDADTAHLTWAEDMAYTRLLRLYYRKERPIPCDVAEACRLVRASSREQREAVASVLNEFFAIQADGWHQKRCDSDVARYQAKAERNREVGKLGGRPKKTGTQKEPTNNHDGYFGEPKHNPPQSPVTKPQTPVASDSVPDGTGGKPPPAAGKSAAEQEAARLWASLKAMLVEQKTSKTVKDAGLLLGKHAAKYGKEVFVDAARATVAAAPVDGHSFLVALCETAAGKRVPLGKPGALSDAQLTAMNQQADTEAKRLLFGAKTGEVIDA